uniref:DUF4220 domain-containing protein n=1 Tax=Oryza punctata TaxID=4537 RepID=A0A0E0MHA6_ORYPU
MMGPPVQWITSTSWLDEKQFMLVGVEFLVVVISGLFVAMFIMNFTRTSSHGGVRRSILNVLDGVSTDMAVYALGAMTAVAAGVGNNPLFPVWALVIVSFHSGVVYSCGFMLLCRAEMVRLLQSMAFPLSSSRSGSPLKVQLWLIWGLLMLRYLYRLVASFKASMSRWSGFSSFFVPDYMRPDHYRSNLRPEMCNPSTMQGYTYLVYGESKQRAGLVKPQYIRHLNMVNSNSLITMDKIWQCNGRLLSRSSSRGDNLKDMCLAFALSGLLNCSAVDEPLQSDCVTVTRGLVRSKILARNADRAFAILEMEIAFLNEKLHTLYPMVYCHGLLSLSLNILRSLVTFGAACWLAVDIARAYTPAEGGAMDNRIHGVNVDIIITWVLMLFMVLKEIWEMVRYLLSDWTKLLLVCKYVQWAGKGSAVERLIQRCLGRRRCDVGGRWHGVFDQYEFLRSLDYDPTSWNRMHRMTLGLLPEKEHGAKLSGAINVPACTKAAVMRALRSMNLEGGDQLPNEIPALAAAAGLMERFGWACQLPSCSQVILVWHIATSLCEIELAEDRGGVDLGRKIPPGFLSSASSCLTGLCRSRQPFLVKESAMDGHLRTDYLVANSLSRYCAYLLISQPGLLPDSLLLPNLIFAAAVRDARQILKRDGDSSLRTRYKQLTQEAEQGILDDDTLKQSGNTVRQGAFLAWNLILIGNRQLRWKILADVWAALIVHIAPTPNPDAHIERLQSGGEFITFIWALLTHLGIQYSGLWSREEATPTAAGAHRSAPQHGADKAP